MFSLEFLLTLEGGVHIDIRKKTRNEEVTFSQGLVQLGLQEKLECLGQEQCAGHSPVICYGWGHWAEGAEGGTTWKGGVAKEACRSQFPLANQLPKPALLLTACLCSSDAFPHWRVTRYKAHWPWVSLLLQVCIFLKVWLSTAPTSASFVFIGLLLSTQMPAIFIVS